jgi:hypothetical protein
MTRKTVIVVWLVALALSLFDLADAQQAKKVPRIGFLSLVARPNSPLPNVEAFRQGLRDLGYVEGQNIVIEYHMQRGRRIGFLTLPPSWFVSKLISSWRSQRKQFWRLRMPLAGSQSS